MDGLGSVTTLCVTSPSVCQALHSLHGVCPFPSNPPENRIGPPPPVLSNEPQTVDPSQIHPNTLSTHQIRPEKSEALPVLVDLPVLGD